MLKGEPKTCIQGPPLALTLGSLPIVHSSTITNRYLKCRSSKPCDSNTKAATDSVNRVIVTDNFEPALLESLRDHFEERFSTPLVTSSDRFIWDYWHVPDQYSLMRTQAEAFFPEDLQAQLEDAVIAFGEKTLGCRGISPIWLSYYVDGHFQNFHTDSPHGPFAFVLSLSPKRQAFRGGETMVLRDNILDFWRNFDSTTGIEMHQIIDLHEPIFSRLCIFDARLPHGVREVQGVRDPLESRVVLHGWFTEPTAFFEGDIDEDGATDVLNSVLVNLYDELGQMAMACGVVVFRCVISPEGFVESLEILANTLRIRPQSLQDPIEALDDILGCIEDHLSALDFSENITSSQGRSQITLPFIFD